MIAEYLTLIARIRHELDQLEEVVTRAERAIKAVRQHPDYQDLYMDAAALNLHDFYTGVERIFQQIGSTVDNHIPSGQNWHQALLQQMGHERPEQRPPALATETINLLDELFRFRHVVRNIYAFQFDPERIARLVHLMRQALEQVQTDLSAFSTFIEQIANDE